MAHTTEDAFAVLTRVSALLARSSRLRERDNLGEAERLLLQAQAALRRYEAALMVTPQDKHKRAEALLRQTNAEIVLVDAVQYAHTRDQAENMRRFAEARRLANGLPACYMARIDICFGAVLLYEGRYQAAVTHLCAALTTATNGSCQPEASHASYHLARAYLKTGRRAEAIALLRHLMPGDEPSRWASAPRHVIAAAVLLATIRWSVWSRQGRQEAHKWRRLAHAHTGTYPMESEALDFIRAWGPLGFLGHALIPDDRRWPEV